MCSAASYTWHALRFGGDGLAGRLETRWSRLGRGRNYLGLEADWTGVFLMAIGAILLVWGWVYALEVPGVG